LRKLIVLAALGLGYLFFWPIDMDPQARDMPRAIERAQVNNVLSQANRISLPNGGHGPEDIAVIGDTVYTTEAAGALYHLEGNALVKIDDLGGRPLGLHAGTDGKSIIIADSYRGIMRWGKQGGLSLIADEVNGEPIIYANQLDVASDGSIYFSNSSDRFDPSKQGGTLPTSVMTIWEQSETGYVARINPDGTAQKLVEGFVYTNGLALSPQEDFLLIAETGQARTLKLWLSGARAGEMDVLIDNLPSYPDNLEAVGDGSYWVGFASPRSPMEFLMPYPFIRKIIWRLGPMVRPAPIRHGQIMRFDGDGAQLEILDEDQGHLGITTGAKPVGDRLYVTSLDGRALGWLPLE